MPTPPTWWAWLNWIGCSTNSFCLVTHDDRIRVNTTQPSETGPGRGRRRDSCGRVALALRGKIWLIGGSEAPLAYIDLSAEWHDDPWPSMPLDDC